MLVLKFGGTSVGNARAIRQVYEIVNGINETKIVVVSAMSGITDSLIKASTLAVNGDEAYRDILGAISERHKNVSIELFGGEVDTVNNLLFELEQILFSIYNLRELSDKANALVQSFGERLNARIVARYFQTKGLKAVPVDAMSFLITTSDYLDANPLWGESKKRAEKIFGRYLKENFVPVVTGYIGADVNGATTTLGRGGSDFTATILGRLLDAREVFIYTDVDGVLTSDPKIVKDAKTIDKLSFEEVRELSYFGAKVMHSKSLIPAMEKNIPIRVLNTFNPAHPHTLITNASEEKKVKAITAIKDIAMVSVAGKGMQGVKGISKRVFESASKSGVNIIMITQSSSEQTIDLFVKGSDCETLLYALKEEFLEEMKLEIIDRINVKKNLSIISVVGNGINASSSLQKEVFRVCASYGIDVVSIVQGSSPHSISFVVKSGDTYEILNALHMELGLVKKLKVINIFQFGIGKVGKALIEIIKENSFKFEENGIRLNYVGLASPHSYAVREEVKEHIERMDFDFAHSGSPVNYIKTLPKNTVIVDVTNSDTITDDLLELLDCGYAVVTSNEKSLAGDFETFKRLTQRSHKFLFEAAVGGSLPIARVIREFLDAGDIVKKIVALPSGVLSFIFALFNRGMDLREAINKAVNSGYTEANPVEDLMGMEMVRKGKMLSYMIGRDFSFGDIEFEPFTKARTLDEFFTNDYEEFLSKLRALSQDGVVYPVVEIEDKLRISLKAFSKDTSFGSLKGGESIFEIYLENFKDTPITIKGPKAGYKAVAMRILQDIFTLKESL